LPAYARSNQRKKPKAESVRLYSRAGDSTFFNIERSDGTGSAWFEASLTGYLISVP
jgi:hypothetical protein